MLYNVYKNDSLVMSINAESKDEAIAKAISLLKEVFDKIIGSQEEFRAELSSLRD